MSLRRGSGRVVNRSTIQRKLSCSKLRWDKWQLKWYKIRKLTLMRNTKSGWERLNNSKNAYANSWELRKSRLSVILNKWTSSTKRCKPLNLHQPPLQVWYLRIPKTRDNLSRNCGTRMPCCNQQLKAYKPKYRLRQEENQLSLSRNLMNQFKMTAGQCQLPRNRNRFLSQLSNVTLHCKLKLTRYHLK